jgi:DNA invertase Pin-like site-specific DNA recombinase
MTPPEVPHDEQSVTTEGCGESMNSSRSTLGIAPGVARATALPRRAVIYIRVSTKAQAERDGNPEGYSLPTQRTACLIRAEQLGATVVDEYIDKDTATRVEKRPAMLALIERVKTERDVDYVIVHQLSRFARSRRDDANITEDLEASGAALISCMEGIDQTTSGRMLQGMLAVVNEYQSRNQSDDIKRKTLQKVKDGGTPALAPIGYLNKQGTEGDKNKRWVEVDPVRAPHITWAFQAYASGTFSLRSLAEALQARGLLQRPTAKRAARPVPANKLQHILRNRYYIGFISYNGIEYEGKHPRLVSPVTFEQVQRLLSAHRQSGERAHRRTHYLKGSLRCYRCKSRLAYGVSRGNGGSYSYFFCLGRHHHRTVCDLPHLSADEVEAAIVNFYVGEELEPTQLDKVREYVLEDLAAAAERRESDRKHLVARITDIQNARNLLADKAMEETIPKDIARERQALLSAQLAHAETELAKLDAITAETRMDINRVFDLARNAAESYRSSSDKLRREWNYARYESLEIDVEYDEPFVALAQRTPIFEGLRSASISKGRRNTTPRRKPGAVLCCIGGSTVELLVEAKGLEPSNLLTARCPRRV